MRTTVVVYELSRVVASSGKPGEEGDKSENVVFGYENLTDAELDELIDLLRSARLIRGLNKAGYA